MPRAATKKTTQTKASQHGPEPQRRDAPWPESFDEITPPATAAAAFEAPSFGPGPVILDDHLSLDAAAAVAEGRRRVGLGPNAAARIAEARGRLETCVRERRLVYGLTTGFGPLANRVVGPQHIERLQRGLVYHLASGVGAPLPWAAARATALARLSSLARGYSGASDDAVGLLVGMLNSPYAPKIPEKGTVGASGDLTPLAHMTLALMGEGGFIDADGRDVANETVFSALSRRPLSLEGRDGLALVNGTSAMTGVALLTAAGARRALAWSVAVTGAVSELMRGTAEAWRAELTAARPHPGQIAVAAALRERVATAPRVRWTGAAERRLPESHDHATEPAPLQDAYTLRCAPQMLGAVADMVRFHADIVERELNAATDNPVFTRADEIALHGGNFMGSHVGLASDALSNAITVLATVTERQIARITDETRNRGLPAFLHRGVAGLDSGLMGAQVTATALVAEMRARAGAASIQSLPTNADNQDVVSMGTIAARGAASLLADAQRVLAIGALAAAQGADIIESDLSARDADAREDGLSPAARALAAQVRCVAAPLLSDRPLASDIEAVAALIGREDPAAAGPSSSFS